MLERGLSCIKEFFWSLQHVLPCVPLPDVEIRSSDDQPSLQRLFPFKGKNPPYPFLQVCIAFLSSSFKEFFQFSVCVYSCFSEKAAEDFVYTAAELKRSKQ